MGRRIHDLATLRFGKLLVIERLPYKSHGQTSWLCKCDCGKETVKRYCDLVTKRPRKNPQNCGCTRCSRIKTKGAHKRIWNTKSNPVSRPIKTALETLYTKKKGHARSREIEFKLTLDEFASVILKPCHYCGAPPSYVHKSGRRNEDICVYSGIDRVDSSLPYTFDNAQACCRKCNYGKHSMSEQEFKEWISSVYNHYVVGKLNYGQAK